MADQDDVVVFGRPRRQRSRPALGRRGRRLLVAATVLACLAGLTWVALARKHDSKPVPASARRVAVADLPVGVLPRVPYCWKGTTIVVDGEPIASRCMVLLPRGESTLAVSEQGVFLLRAGAMRVLASTPPSVGMPALSQDGKYAAWVTADGDRGVLMVYNTRSRRLLGLFDVATPNMWVPGIDDVGRVYLHAVSPPSRMWMFDIASRRLTPVRGAPLGRGRPVTFVAADGFAVEDARFTDSGTTSRSVVGTVTSRGRFVSRGPTPVGVAAWSPHRSRVVQETADGFEVQPANDLSARSVLRLPTDGRVSTTPVWETEDTVLMVFDPGAQPGVVADDPGGGFDTPMDQAYVLRCFVVSGRCEVALGPGNGGELIGSMLR